MSSATYSMTPQVIETSSIDTSLASVEVSKRVGNEKHVPEDASRVIVLNPDLLQKPSPRPLFDPFEEDLLDNYTDEQLHQYLSQSPYLTVTRREYVRILSPNFLAKPIQTCADPKDEIAALELARAIGIRVPHVRRFVPYVETMSRSNLSTQFIIMERVHGPTLEQLWPTLGFWHTLRLAWQLRGFLSIMRAVTSPTMGGLNSGIATSLWFQDMYGPAQHASPSVFSGYLTCWLTECQLYGRIPRPELVLQPHENQFHFVHQDLAPRNMIVDAHGQLWVVDWGHAGYYPAYMEYLGIKDKAMPWTYERTWGAWYGWLRWVVFRWIVARPEAPHVKARTTLGVVHDRSCRFRMMKTPYSYVPGYDKAE